MKKRAHTRACCECVIHALNACLLQMRHTGVYSRECCECNNAVSASCVSGYAVNVASKGSYVRDPRCVYKGRVLGLEQPVVDVTHCTCVYGLKSCASFRVECDYE